MRKALEAARPRSGKGAPLLVLVVFVLAAVVAGCGGGSDSGGSSGGAKLDVVGYSTPESVYQEDLEPAFQKTSAGEGVSFSNSFGASGDQSRAVVAGQPASVVHFAQAGDMERLVEEGGIVAKDWTRITMPALRACSAS